MEKARKGVREPVRCRPRREKPETLVTHRSNCAGSIQFLSSPRSLSKPLGSRSVTKISCTQQPPRSALILVTHSATNTPPLFCPTIPPDPGVLLVTTFIDGVTDASRTFFASASAYSCWEFQLFVNIANTGWWSLKLNTDALTHELGFYPDLEIAGSYCRRLSGIQQVLFLTTHSTALHLTVQIMHVFKVNCYCHVINNCVKYVVKNLDVEVESIVKKKCVGFSSAALKTKKLKQHFEFALLE